MGFCLVGQVDWIRTERVGAGEDGRVSGRRPGVVKGVEEGGWRVEVCLEVVDETSSAVSSARVGEVSST